MGVERTAARGTGNGKTCVNKTLSLLDGPRHTDMGLTEDRRSALSFGDRERRVIVITKLLPLNIALGLIHD